jgi:murein DD-endopeptidase MepM/ murein hydrolase activator NlpD
MVNRFLECSLYASLKLVLLGATTTLIAISSSAKAQAQNYLPYPAGKTYSVTQTWGGPFSHQNTVNRYAVDFGMPANQPVVAVASGKVHKAWSGGSNLSRGCNSAYINNANYVVIDHGNGTSSLYVHLNAVNVSVGQTIRQGQQIGLSGDTGWTCNANGTGTGPHLHFSFQKTTSGVFGESIGQGFVETGNVMPVASRSYTSQNRGIPSVAMLVTEPTNRTLDSGGGAYPYLHNQQIPGNAYHLWELRPVADGKYMIISKATNQPLDGGGENNGRAYLHPQQMPSNPYQQWRLEPARSGYMVINVATGRALDSGGANGTQVYMHPTPMPGNTFHIWKLQ